MKWLILLLLAFASCTKFSTNSIEIEPNAICIEVDRRANDGGTSPSGQVEYYRRISHNGDLVSDGQNYIRHKSHEDGKLKLCSNGTSFDYTTKLHERSSVGRDYAEQEVYSIIRTKYLAR